MWAVASSGVDKGRAVELDGDAFTIGSGPGCSLVLSDPDVAPLHVSLRPQPDGTVEIVPLAAERPLLLDGAPLSAPRAARPGQILTVGDVEIALVAERPADPDHAIEPALAEALGSDGEHADDDLGGWGRIQRRRTRRVGILAAAALAVAVLAGALALTGVLGGGDDGRTDVAGIVRDAAPGTLRVVARAEGQEGSGTGWVLDDREGLVVTNFHVVNGGSDFAVEVDGAERDASIVGAAPCDDLAVLRVGNRRGLRALTLTDPGSVEQGEPVVAIGYPAGAGDGDLLSSTTGVVSVPSQPLRSPSPDAPDFPDMIQTDAAINPGNSGGPLLDEQRRVVGVNTAVLLEQGGVPLQNVGYAIGAGRVREVVENLRRRRSASWLGTGLQFLPPDELRNRGLPTGVFAQGAAPGTPADRAGLGDQPVLITRVDDRALNGTMPDWCQATRGRSTGDQVTVGVLSERGGRERRVPLAFG